MPIVSIDICYKCPQNFFSPKFDDNLYQVLQNLMNQSLTDSDQPAFISDIRYEMHPSPVTLWEVILIFVLFILLAGNMVPDNLIIL